MKEFHPEQLKKLSDALPKVDLNFDNFELWMTVMSAADGTNPIINFESWALGLSSPMKNKKKFFYFCLKKCHFSKFCMLNNKLTLGSCVKGQEGNNSA